MFALSSFAYKRKGVNKNAKEKGNKLNSTSNNNNSDDNLIKCNNNFFK